MLKLYLYRHAQTSSNIKRLYLGSSDEPICTMGRECAQKAHKAEVERLFVSPMLRCRDTAELIFPNMCMEEVEGLRECSFGIFEKKSYEEIKDDPHFLKWCKSDESYSLPQGESILSFKRRCHEAFFATVSGLISQGVESAAFVIHGGSIMAVMDEFYVEKKGFYYWQANNCDCYSVFARMNEGTLVLNNAQIIKTGQS